MTKIAIVPNAAGTGTFTIEAPNSNSNRTLTLPDAAGELLTDVSDIETQVKAATNATGSAPVFACRAWVNFDGTTGPATIRASGNVSSVARNGTGDYTVNFTTAMPDANYATTVNRDVSAASSSARICSVRNASDVLTTSVRLFSYFNDAGGNGASNATYVSVSIFR